MAGSGRKVFTAGDVLTASDVQNYLQDQTVMVFGGTAARSAAIATPTEGMFAVTTDTDEVDYYDGSAWVPALPVGAWTGYTPTFTNFTLNNGSIGFAYTQIGKTVHVRGGITLGTTSSVTGNFRFSLPVTAVGSAGNSFIGHARYSDQGVNSYYGTVELVSTTVGGFIILNTGGTYTTITAVSGSVPFTWGSTDDIRLYLTYQAL